MSNISDRLRNLLRELSDISEKSSRSNVYNIHLYENNNFYNSLPKEGQQVNNPNLGNTNLETTNNSFLENTNITPNINRFQVRVI